MYEECKVKLESQEREFRQSYELIVAENKVLRTEKMMMEQRMADMANQYGMLKTRYDSLDQNFNDLMEHSRSQGQGQGPLQGRLLVNRPANTNHANQTQLAQDLNVDRRNFNPNFSNQNIGQNLRSNMNYTNQPKTNATNPTNAGFNTWLNSNHMAQNVQKWEETERACNAKRWWMRVPHLARWAPAASLANNALRVSSRNVE